MPIQEYLPIILTIALTVLTIVITVVGVYVIQVLRRVKATIDRANHAIDIVELKVLSVTSPLQSLNNMVATMGAGAKIFESFAGWLSKSKGRDKER